MANHGAWTPHHFCWTWSFAVPLHFFSIFVFFLFITLLLGFLFLFLHCVLLWFLAIIHQGPLWNIIISTHHTDFLLAESLYIYLFCCLLDVCWMFCSDRLARPTTWPSPFDSLCGCLQVYKFSSLWLNKTKMYEYNNYVQVCLEFMTFNDHYCLSLIIEY